MWEGLFLMFSLGLLFWERFRWTISVRHVFFLMVCLGRFLLDCFLGMAFVVKVLFGTFFVWDGFLLGRLFVDCVGWDCVFGKVLF